MLHTHVYILVNVARS